MIPQWTTRALRFPIGFHCSPTALSQTTQPANNIAATPKIPFSLFVLISSPRKRIPALAIGLRDILVGFRIVRHMVAVPLQHRALSGQ